MMPAVRQRGRSGRRTDTPGLASTLARGAAAIAVVIAFVVLGVEAFNGVPGRSYLSLNAVVPNIGNLLEHDSVSIAGVNVGQITGRSITSGGQGELQLQIDPGVTLRAGTQIVIRANGLLGGRYVQLIPGSGPVLRSGATIRGGPNTLTFGVPETLDTFDSRTRTALGETVNGFGAGLVGRGVQLNAMVHTVNDGTLPLEVLATGILARPGAAARLLPSLNGATSTLAAHRVELSELPGALSGVLRPLLAERRSLAQTLTDAPPALAAATAGLGNGERLVVSLTSLAQQANLTLPQLPGGLSDAAALLTQAQTPLERANGLLRAVKPASPALLRITSSASPLLAPVRQAASNLTPMLIQIGRYRCDIENFGAVFRSMTGRGGVGSGPGGPAMEFRVQVSAFNPTEILGIAASPGVGHHDAYSPPCTYLSTVYPNAF
jgi:ABC-type transporter Mla subunit MlaD